MSQLEAEGTLVVGGGFLENSGAMGVIRASDLAEATATVADDPAVQNGVVTVKVHPWFVTVAGHIDKSG